MKQEGTFETSDKLSFYKREWIPDEAKRANLVLIHGYGEHCSRYDEMACALNGAGIAVFSYDQRGFGRSPGVRAFIYDFDLLLKDLDAYLACIRPSLEDGPVFMMGHSMGGMVLANYIMTRQPDLRGLIFSSPFLGFNPDVPRFVLALAGILGTLVPWLPVGAVDNTGLSRIPEVVASADNDPLSYHGKVKARTGAQFNLAIRYATAGFDKIVRPMLVLHGSGDKIVPCSGSRLLYEKAGSTDKTLKIFEGGYHELWNDLCKEEMIGDVREWMLARI
jgi:alpha-beta hydrolase superfamily lysophospholipase